MSLAENDIYQGDSIHLLEQLIGEKGEESVDLGLTDPPYFLDKLDNEWSKKEVDSKNYQDKATVTSLPAGMKFDPQQGQHLYRFYLDVSKLMYRVLKPGAYFISFSSPRLYHRMACAVEDAGFLIRDQWLWIYLQNQVKAQGMQKFLKKAKWLTDDQKSEIEKELVGWKTPQIRSNFEPMCLAQKPLDGTFLKNQVHHGVGLINCSHKVGEGRFVSNVMSTYAGMYEVDDETTSELLRHFLVGKPSKKEKGDYNDHKTVKPLELCKHLISLTTLKGALVLDPFVGSGTTCVAAHLLGRRYYGFDLDEHNVKIAKRRIEEAMTPGNGSERQGSEIPPAERLVIR